MQPDETFRIYLAADTACKNPDSARPNSEKCRYPQDLLFKVTNLRINYEFTRQSESKHL